MFSLKLGTSIFGKQSNSHFIKSHVDELSVSPIWKWSNSWWSDNICLIFLFSSIWSKFSDINSVWSWFIIQSTDVCFNNLVTCPIFTAFNSEIRYTYKSAASSSTFFNIVPYINIWTFLLINGKSLWEKLRTPLPIICSILFTLYQGSIICICRITLKSNPSEPAWEIKTTFIFCPDISVIVPSLSSLNILSLFVKALTSISLDGEIRGSPVIIIYLATRKSFFEVGGFIVLTSTKGVGGVLNNGFAFSP